jgi:ferredoxin
LLLVFSCRLDRKNYGVFKSPAESSDNGLAALSFQRFNAGAVQDGLRAASSAATLIAYGAFLSNVPLHFYEKAMADAANKYAENVPGKFYVDDQCIDCDLCRETAPANFKRNDDGGHSYVYKQPETPGEEGLCKEAMEGCPVEAIGNDGA